MKSEHYKEEDCYGSFEWWGEKQFTDDGYNSYYYYYHRVDGPAYIRNADNEWYYILNKIVSKEDFYTPGFIDAFILEHS